MKYLNIQEHTLAALAHNETYAGTPLIFIHAITSSVYFWEKQTPYIQQNRRWYSLSLPGHYPAVFPNGFQRHALTAEMIASLLRDAIHELIGDTPFIVAGYSTGGFAALAVAATMPEQVTGVISVAGFAKGYLTGALRMYQVLARHFGVAGDTLFRLGVETTRLTPEIFRTALQFYAADRRALYAYPGLDEALNLIYPAFKCLDTDAMLSYFTRLPDIDITAWLPRITAPTLVIVGDKDGIVPPEQSYLIAARVPQSELHVLPGSGHLPMLERETPYADIITTWAKAHP